MRSRAAGLATLPALLAAASCGAPPGPPPACLSGAQSVLDALEAAPGAVRIDGTTPISECLAANPGPGTAEGVGGALVEAAAKLADNVAQRHDSRSALELGYLVGAARRGAGEVPTVHSELLRRLELETERLDTGAPSYRQGQRAGETSG
jgi:hypothetical protein